MRAEHRGEDLPGQRRCPLARCHRDPGQDRLFARGHAVQQRLRRRQHVLRQCARMAGAARSVRQHREVRRDHAGRRLDRHVLAHRECRPLPRGDGWLRSVRHRPQRRSRYGGKLPAAAALRPRADRHLRPDIPEARGRSTGAELYGRLSIAKDGFFSARSSSPIRPFPHPMEACRRRRPPDPLPASPGRSIGPRSARNWRSARDGSRRPTSRAWQAPASRPGTH